MSKRILGVLACGDCGNQALRHSFNQRYCQPCSALRDAARQRNWAAKNCPKQQAEASAVTLRGIEISQAQALGVADTMQPVVMAWFVRIAVPFDWAASKNYIYGLRVGGHVRLREEVKSYRDLIGWKLREALGGQRIVQNRVWIDIFVQKTHHRGDAVNFVDTICDAIKRVIPVDDKWYSIRRLDWQIVKGQEGRVFIGVGQEVGAEDVQACSSCGRLLPFGAFHKKGDSIVRNCKECRAK